jgi:hypothetical protein
LRGRGREERERRRERGERGEKRAREIPKTSFFTVVLSFLTDSGSSMSGSPIAMLFPLKHAAMWN